MPVNQRALLSDCQDQLEYLEADLNAQAEADADLAARLRAEYTLAREAGRVGDAYEIWRAEQATQAAVQWVLGGVFVRFLEDNWLLAEPLLAGDGDRGRLAEAAEQAFIAANPSLHERHWFLHVFRTVGRLPGASGLFDEAHNPVFHWPLTPEAAKRLLQFWRRTDPATGELAHAFTDPEWDTRFLGDLYQELSESARKRYALLQTPIFVEEFILDRTLGEALQQLPLPKVTAIDPTCGSGHFLLGAFARLLAAWERQEPGTPREALAQRALDQVAGVDLNPFAVAIARFRLLLASLRACGVTRLDRAPSFQLHVAAGDSLLHGDEFGSLGLGDGGTGRFVGHAFSEEDLAAVNALLNRRYTVVVGNPPYIVPKDKALNKAYRQRYSTCYQQYALSVPFIERFWQLADTDAAGGVSGWVGQITANSFMKCDFGRKLIEEYFPRVDLTHVIDTEGAYIPGHGTPTVILVGRARPPLSTTVRTASGLRGEPSVPSDPSKGKFWLAITSQVDLPGSRSDFVEVLDVPRSRFHVYPWTLASGDSTKLRTQIESTAPSRVSNHISAVGFQQDTHADFAFVQPTAMFRRTRLEDGVRPHIRGENVRHWAALSTESIVFPFDEQLEQWTSIPRSPEWAWFHALKVPLSQRAAFAGGTYEENGIPWFSYHQFPKDRARTPLCIVFAETSTHTHFAFHRGGVVFNRSAPIIKLPAGRTARDYILILGYLNSSTACYWLRQVCQPKGGSGIGRGIQSEAWEQRFRFNSENVANCPIPSSDEILPLAERLDAFSTERQENLPASVLATGASARTRLDAARSRAEGALGRMITLQEELDWRCYELYGVTTEDLTYRDASGAPQDPPALHLGERAFEIVLARRMAAGEMESTWFARHGSTPITELPTDWPANYRGLVERRIAAIENDRSLGLIERPEYKRRWNVEPWENLEEKALRTWLLDRLETPPYWPEVAFQSTRDLAARAALDPEFGQTAALWAGAEGVELEPTIRRLVLDEAVPFLPALRYTEDGREKRRVWERTWELQRQEDEVDAQVAASFARRDGESDQGFTRRLAEEQKRRRAAEVGDIPRPPKYTSADFQSTVFWRLRGALDVPKERFILYPFATREGDDAPIVGWAGWNHLQQAQALTAWYAERTERDGWTGDRLIPLLAGMAELLPWLKQWHNEIDPEFGDRPGDVYESWLEGELLQHGLTRAALDAWEPPRAARRRGRRTAARQE